MLKRNYSSKNGFDFGQSISITEMSQPALVEAHHVLALSETQGLLLYMHF
jgi:hypothetical protein